MKLSPKVLSLVILSSNIKRAPFLPDVFARIVTRNSISWRIKCYKFDTWSYPVISTFCPLLLVLFCPEQIKKYSSQNDSKLSLKIQFVKRLIWWHLVIYRQGLAEGFSDEFVQNRYSASCDKNIHFFDLQKNLHFDEQLISKQSSIFIQIYACFWQHWRKRGVWAVASGPPSPSQRLPLAWFRYCQCLDIFKISLLNIFINGIIYCKYRLLQRKRFLFATNRVILIQRLRSGLSDSFSGRAEFNNYHLCRCKVID